MCVRGCWKLDRLQCWPCVKVGSKNVIKVWKKVVLAVEIEASVLSSEKSHHALGTSTA
jgi:hypothetical protein